MTRLGQGIGICPICAASASGSQGRVGAKACAESWDHSWTGNSRSSKLHGSIDTAFIVLVQYVHTAARGRFPRISSTLWQHQPLREDEAMAGVRSRSLPAGAFVARLSAGALRGARSCVVAAALWAPTCMLVCSPPVGLNNGRTHRRLLRGIVGAILALALSLCAGATGATGAAGATRDKLVKWPVGDYK